MTPTHYIDGSAPGNVYVSRNGGMSFKKTLDGVHYCRFLDEGTITICAPGYNYITFFW